MFGSTLTRIGNRFRPAEHIHIETGPTVAGPIDSGMLSAQWLIEPVEGSAEVRFRNAWKPTHCLHAERGVPETGPIEPGWISARWVLEVLRDSPFCRIRSALTRPRYIHIEHGAVDVGFFDAGQLSAQWSLETVEGTHFVRLRNRWKPTQGLHIERGPLAVDTIDQGMLSAQWEIESLAGSAYVRIRNRWKPEQHLHMESGRPETGPVGDGWWSAQWILEQVDGTEFVRLRNRVEMSSYLHLELGALALGPIQPGWLSAQWRTALQNKLLSPDLIQRKFDEFINHRNRPLFVIRIHGTRYGHSELSVLFDDAVTGYRPDGEPIDLGHLEIDTFPNPDFYIDELRSDSLRARVVSVGSLGIHAELGFETAGTEIKINNFLDVDLDSLKIAIGLTFGFDSVHGRIQLLGADTTVATHASVNVDILPDGYVDRTIEARLNDKVRAKLLERRDDWNALLTRFLVGGDFQVTYAISDDRGLYYEYLVPVGTVEPFPERPQPPLEIGPLANIDHIVVLMMENRSFDHMLGHLSLHGGRSDIDGLTGAEKNVFDGVNHVPFRLQETVFPVSPCHGHECVMAQINGGAMDGFAANFSEHNRRGELPALSPGDIMGYYSAEQLPVYSALAREFLVCQRWFAAHPGPTFPNRFYTLTGRLNRTFEGHWEKNNPELASFSPVATKTVLDHLTAANVTWRYFEHGYCFLRLFERYTVDTEHIVDARAEADGFFARARAGTLPSVSFVDPDFIDVPPGNDDGPPADVRDGQHLVAEIVRALMAGPKWQRTLLIVTYDEHGGFYDHVAPPAAIAVSDVGQLGVRVPALVVSPLVARGQVSNIVFDHTSIAKTIVRRFLSQSPPDLGDRANAANDLSMALQAQPRQDTPEISLPPQSARAHLTRRPAVATSADPDDFKELLKTMRARFPKPGTL